MSILKANLIALIYPLPFAVVYTAAYIASSAFRSGSSGEISLFFDGRPIVLLFELLLYIAAFFCTGSGTRRDPCSLLSEGL